VLQEFRKFQKGEATSSKLVTVISAEEVLKEGAEFCPEQYLPQPEFPEEEQERYREDIVKSILRTTVSIDDIADEVLTDFPQLSGLPELPYGESDVIEKFFYVKGGKSSGEGNYNDGSCPYVSSGDPLNSIIRLVGDVAGEVFEQGAITVTCLLKRISESDIEVNRIHCKSDGMKIIFKDIIQSPGEISIYIKVFEGSPSGTCL